MALLATGGILYWRHTLYAEPVSGVQTPTDGSQLPTDNGGPPDEPVVPIAQIPILMYHVIGDDNSSMQELYVNPDVFAEQMRYLRDQGYNTVTMGELHAHWQEGAPLPTRPIVITFDDGYRSIYDLGFPIMRTYGVKAVHYLYVDKIGLQSGVTVAQIAEMLEAGHEVGNHTYTHIDLTKANPQRLVRETEAAKIKLEELLGIDIVSYAYPAGRFNAEVVKAVGDSGHALAVTTQYGYSSQEQGLLTLKRIRINRSDGLQGFIKKLQPYELLQPR